MLAAAAAGLLVVTFAWASPASASSSQGYVIGSGSVLDDFNDEGNLSTSSHAHSGATLLWQWILYADAVVLGPGDLDCQFGTKTKQATQAWQREHNLPDDGVVGPATFAAAGKHLTINSNYSVTYHGLIYTAGWFRDPSNGRYQNVGGQWAAYNSYSGC
jgi:hypothetical protein